MAGDSEIDVRVEAITKALVKGGPKAEGGLERMGANGLEVARETGSWDAEGFMEDVQCSLGKNTKSTGYKLSFSWGRPGWCPRRSRAGVPEQLHDGSGGVGGLEIGRQ